MKHLLHYAALGLLLAACSKGSDPGPGSNSNSGTTNGSTGSTGSGSSAKSHTVTFNYVTNGLDTKRTNLGAAVRIFVDKTPLMLGSAVDTAYYVAPQDGSGTYSKTMTVTGTTLKLVLSFDNVYGTAAQPRDKSGAALSLGPPPTRFLAVPTIDGKAVTDGTVTLGGYTASTTTTFSYDNGKNPSKIVEIDLTKL